MAATKLLKPALSIPALPSSAKWDLMLSQNASWQTFILRHNCNWKRTFNRNIRRGILTWIKLIALCPWCEWHSNSPKWHSLLLYCYFAEFIYCNLIECAFDWSGEELWWLLFSIKVSFIHTNPERRGLSWSSQLRDNQSTPSEREAGRRTM